MLTSLSTLIILLLGAILLVYFAILLNFSSHISHVIFLEKFVVIFFILLIAGGFHKIAIFSKLNPSYLLTEGQPPGLAFIITSIIFFATLITLNLKLRLSFKKFLNSLLHLVLYNPFLAILILLTPVSALWSITPFSTLARGLIFLGVTAAAIYVGSCYQWNALFRMLRWGFAFAMIQSTFLAIVIPSIGVSGKGWQGSFEHAGTLGLYAALTSILWLIQLLSAQKKSLLSVFILVLSLFVMQRTNSATGLILFFQGMSVILTINLMKKLRPKLSFLVMLVSTSFIILVVYSFNYYYNDLLIFLGKSPDLTGRGEFWPQLVEKITERPILGYGFEGFWLPWKGDLNPAITIFNSNFYVPHHAHNGFLDLALSLGLLGLALFTIACFVCIFYIYQNIRDHRNFAIVPLVLLLFIVIANTSGPGLWAVGFHSFLLVLISTRLTLDTIKPKPKFTNL